MRIFRVPESSKKGAQLSIRLFTLARDYLLCNLTMATGTRPGTLTNVLVSDYETSRVSAGNRIILVPEQKRTKDGPAMLGMHPQMQAEMEIYVKNIRSKRMDMAFQREPLEGMWWLSFKKVVWPALLLALLTSISLFPRRLTGRASRVKATKWRR